MAKLLAMLGVTQLRSTVNLNYRLHRPESLNPKLKSLKRTKLEVYKNKTFLIMLHEVLAVFVFKLVAILNLYRNLKSRHCNNFCEHPKILKSTYSKSCNKQSPHLSNLKK